ncbi:MAG: 4Fe-4S binding protein, partial [Erysipelotrichaceae bacterium]|nr:4Fe-4S binding protein [Erysipelotrichaceae bacterium]
MKKKTVVSYTLEHCVRCMRCVKTCPTSALSMFDNRITINDSKCLNCGRCIRACHSKGLLAKGSSIEHIKDYDYTVCLIPGAMSCACNSLEQAADLFNAVKELGFDEVVDMSDIEGQIMTETRFLSENKDISTVISSACPVINRLIEERYPMLLAYIAPLRYASEVAASQVRKRLSDKSNVGIFCCCECEAKLQLAKYPYHNMEYEVDHALAIVDIFPRIRANLGKGSYPVTFCREGLQSCSPYTMQQKETDLITDGFEKINDILDMTEFGLLEAFRLFYLYQCYNGCIGGHLLWGNSYLTKNNIDALSYYKRKPVSKIPFEELSFPENSRINFEKFFRTCPDFRFNLKKDCELAHKSFNTNFDFTIDEFYT